jgi:hypothetical protein
MGPSLNSPGPDITVSDIPGSDIPEPLEYQASRKTDNLAGSRKKFLLPMIFLILLATVGAISMFALGRKGFSEWSPWHEASQNQDDQLRLPPQEQDALSPKPQITQSTSLWSASGNWQTTFSKIPLGANIQALAEEISRPGALMNPSDFWDRIDHSDKSKPSTEANRLVDYLQKLPIDSLSSITNTSSSDWRVLGFQLSERKL